MRRIFNTIIFLFTINIFVFAQSKNEIGIEINTNLSGFIEKGPMGTGCMGCMSNESINITSKTLTPGGGIGLYDKIKLDGVAITISLRGNYIHNNFLYEGNYSSWGYEPYTTNSSKIDGYEYLDCKFKILYLEPELGMNIYLTKNLENKKRIYIPLHISPLLKLIDWSGFDREFSYTLTEKRNGVETSSTGTENKTYGFYDYHTLSWNAITGIGLETAGNQKRNLHFEICLSQNLNSYQILDGGKDFYLMYIHWVELKVGIAFN